MAAVCTPVVSTRGHGTATMTYVRQDSEAVSTDYGDYTNLADIYSFQAVADAGWTFDHWEIETTYDHGTYMGTADETHETLTDSGSSAVNPFATASFDVATSPSYSSIGEYFGTGRYRPYYKTLTYTITAVFTHVSTDLLVNSSTAVSPVTLVYSPTTNLLVADY